MDTGDSPPRERRVYNVKAAYFKLIEAGVKLSLKDLARRSEELTGEQVAYELIRKTAAREGWVQQARVMLEEHNPEEYRRTRVMLDIMHARIMEADEPKDLTPASRAYLTLLTDATVDIIHLEEERILEVRDELFRFIEDKGETMQSMYLSRLVYTYGQLRKRVEADLTVTEEDGINPDALLMGM